MDQVGELELAWSQGYSGTPALYIDKETVTYKCGSSIKFISDDLTNQQYFPSPGDGVGVLAVQPINKVFAFSEACLEPRIFVFGYPLFQPLGELHDGASLDFSHLAFSTSLYLVSVSALPEFQMIIWNYDLGHKLCVADLECHTPTSISVNPCNWRQICVTTETSLDVWTAEVADDKSNITKESLSVPTVSMMMSAIEEKDRDEMMPTRASTRLSKLTVSLPRAAIAGLVGEMAENFDQIEDDCPRVRPVSHCWSSTGGIYIGCDQGQLLHVDTDILRVCMLYNPTPGTAMNDLFREDTLKLTNERAPSEMSVKSSKSTTSQGSGIGDGAFNTLILNKNHLFAGGLDGTLRVLETSALGVKVIESTPLGNAISSLSFNTSYRNIAIGSNQGTLHLYTPEDAQEREILDCHHGKFVGIGYLVPGDVNCATVREDGEVQCWSLDSGKLISTMPIGLQATSLKCSPLGHFVTVGSAAGHVYVIDFNDPENPRIVERMKLHSGPVTHLQFDEFGELLVSGSDDNVVMVTHARPSLKFQPIGFVSCPGEVRALALYTDDKRKSTQIVATLYDGKDGAEEANRMVVFNLTDEQIREPPLASLKCDFRTEDVQKIVFNFSVPTFGAILGEKNLLYCLNGKTKKIDRMTIPTEAPKKPTPNLHYRHSRHYNVHKSLLSRIKEYSKDSYLVTDDTLVGHELAGGMLELSLHKQWMASCSPDGYVSVRILSQPDQKSSIFPHSYSTGGVTIFGMSPDCEKIITTGKDGIVSCYKWRFASDEKGKAKWQPAKDFGQQHFSDLKSLTESEDAAILSMKDWSPAPLPSRVQSASNDALPDALEVAIENDEIYTTPTPIAGADATWKEIRHIEAVREEDKEYSEQKQNLRTQIREMRRNLQSMMRENEEIPDIEKLGRHEFDLDIDEQVRLQQDGEAEVQRIREQIEFDNLAKMYLRELIKMQCWDEMVVKGRTIGAFNSILEVSNYPMRPRDESFLADLERVEAQRRVEMSELLERQNVLELSQLTHSVFADLALMDDYLPLEDELDEEADKDGKEQPSTIGSLGAQFGGSSEYFYSQFELLTREHKVNQSILLRDAIYRIKTTFNKEFEDVMVKKDQEIGKIRDKNKRIRKIMEDLYMMDEIVDPEMTLLERPERLLTVEDDEIDVEKFLTPEQQKKAEAVKKQEEERLLKEKGDNARERALDMMMGGVLEVKKEDELKKDVPVPVFMTFKPVDEWSEDEVKLVKEYEKKVKDLNEEREKYKKQLETELKKLQGFIQEGTQSFDELLYNLFSRKIKTEMVIYQEELKMVRMKYTILVEDEMGTRERELQRMLAHKRALKVLTVQAVLESRKNVETFTDFYDLLLAEDKVLDKSFKREYSDVSAVMVEQLYKLFKKRPRAPKLKEETHLGQAPTSSKTNNPFLDRPSSAKQHDNARRIEVHMEAALSEMDKKSNIPEGLDLDVWDRLCHSRRYKVEKEQMIKQKALVLAEMNAFVQKRTLEDERTSSQINELIDEINMLKEDRMRYQCNLEVQLLLKQGQVEVDSGSFIHNFKTSILVHRKVVEDLNSKIRNLGESKISSMVESKDFRKGIIHQEWEQKKMLMEMDDLKNKMRDIQMLKVSREIQAFLYEDDHEAKKAQEIATLEQTILGHKQHHEGNVDEKRSQTRDLNRSIHEKQEGNHELDRVLDELNVSVNERRHIEEVNADKKLDTGAEQRYQDIVQRRKLVDLAKAQAQEVAVLRAEVERQRMRTFPALVQVDR